MRRINFRAWDKLGKQMLPCLQNLWLCIEHPADFEVMQFTGLIDKNGKEIYEGDLLEGFSRNSGPLEVQYSDGHYEIHFHKDASASVHRHCPWIGYKEAIELKIVGNIHEDSDLLK